MENDVRIIVEGKEITVVLPRRMNSFATPWQDAWRFGEILEEAAKSIEPDVLVNMEAVQESNQFKISSFKTNVVLMFDWTDRIKLTRESALIVARAVRQKAQDVNFEFKKKLKFQYKNGRVVKVLHG